MLVRNTQDGRMREPQRLITFASQMSYLPVISSVIRYNNYGHRCNRTFPVVETQQNVNALFVFVVETEAESFARSIIRPLLK